MISLSKDECLRKIQSDKESWNELRKANLEWMPDLDGVEFGDADLFNVNLKNCSLVRANLSSVKSLQEKQIGGANLNAAKLPDYFNFNGLQTVEELSRNSSVLFITLIASCLYCWLTIFSTKNIELLTNSSSSELPIVNVSISIKWFYIFAPVILTTFYLYFHFYLKNLWKELSELPAYFPDGKSLDQKAYSWIIIDFVVGFMGILKTQCDHSIFRKFQSFNTGFLAWWFVPVTIIAIWTRFLIEHAVWASLFQSFVAIYAIYFAFAFYKLAKDTLCCSSHTRFEKYHILINSIVAVFLLTISIIHPYFPVYSYKFDDQAQLVKKPENWDEIRNTIDGISYLDPKFRKRFKQALISIATTHYNNRNFKGLIATGSFLVKADLEDADLRGAVLFRANMQGASLKNTNLQGAFLQEASLQGANFKKTNLQGAILNGADLKGARGLTFDMLKRSNIDEETVLPDNLLDKRDELLKLSHDKPIRFLRRL